MKKAFFRISIFYVRGEPYYFPRSISLFLQIVGVLIAGLIVPSTDRDLLQRALTSYCPLLNAFGTLTSPFSSGRHYVIQWYGSRSDCQCISVRYWNEERWVCR